MSKFGVDLNCSSFELHPSSSDAQYNLRGNYCASIRFSDGITNQLLDYAESRRCKAGMQIGSMTFNNDKSGKISLDRIDRNIVDCPLTITAEKHENIEIYKTQYDPPPSTAMFLERKGFVFSKLIIKHQNISNANKADPRSTGSHRPNTQIKAIRSKNKHLNKRRANQMNGFENPPNNKRLKTNSKTNRNKPITLKESIKEILFLKAMTFSQIKDIINSRTNLVCDNAQFKYTINEVASFYDVDNQYYLKPEMMQSVDVLNSTVLTKSEKDDIKNRGNGGGKGGGGNESKQQETPPNSRKNSVNDHNNNKSDKSANDKDMLLWMKFEDEYVPILNKKTYEKYTKTHSEKIERREQIEESIRANKAYFLQMRDLIRSEKSAAKKKEMTGEFRLIFTERQIGVKKMELNVKQIKIELRVLKKRINAYVTSQQ